LRRFTSATAVAAAVLALAVAGCGSSSKKSSNTSTSSAATTTTTSTSTTTTGTSTSGALSKAQYEAKLGPLLNGHVVPALRSALANGGARNPDKLKTAVGALNEAHDAMASITPPPKVADLNQQAVTILASLSSDLSKMRSALLDKNKSDYVNAAKGAVKDALKLQNVGNQLTARGF
jgi:outer membrane lipoprotein SlyB